MYDDIDEGRERAGTGSAPGTVAPSSGLSTLETLGQVYKQLQSSVGEFGLATLQLSTRGLASGSASDDSVYTSTENQLANLGAQRDALTSQVSALLEGAAFGGATLDTGQAQSLVARGRALIDRANRLAGRAGFQVSFRGSQPGQGEVLFGSGPGCSGLVEVATQDQGAGTIEHSVAVTGNDLPGSVGDNGIVPGVTYWYETVTITASGQEVDNNGGRCYSVTMPPA